MFEFVTVNHPHEMHDRQRQKRIRQHAIRNGMQNKRKEEARRNDNFVASVIDARTGKLRLEVRSSSALVLPKPLSGGRLDPFDSLPGDGERLRSLMAHKSARSAGEPVFCVEDAGKIFFEGLDDVFRGALSDPLMFHALSLALALAANMNVPNVECLTQRGATLRNLRHRMSNPGLVPSVSTLTAMLMIIGYEYRVDGSNANSISTHLSAIKNVVELTNASNVSISDAIRRALFWQDLYSCLFVGTTRLLSHRDYEETSRETLPSSAAGSFVSPGFENIISDFPGEFAEIMGDLNALCTLVDTRCSPGDLPLRECPIDNFQYYIESRLVDLLSQNRFSGTEDHFLQACIYASFFVTYNLSTGIWEGCFIPEWCATQVMTLLTKTRSDPRWKEERYENLLLWLLFVSGAMAKRNRIRSRAINMVHGCFHDLLDGLYDDWDQLLKVMKTFVWSSHSMEQKVWQFWQDLHSPQPGIGRFEEEIGTMHPA
ncbi:uncharacterized protein CC84DRAFT_732716 [Paraphaeosphaeria sporulosa]|uniref:Transcription factor domain-containing protein n=1 Tax=Paraphaeosphaeria sporulosa TaxID=1460663 RepID=A0A177CEI8_9PLEO|nr:uncharacterized protein CC84DRAFT_732716 [Paraphaeosphaeria sporulosa]OAG05726.1 hypothetical protein CC84DRAFT_732716 [Paraphaeosphaeria sporulosa]